MLQFGVLGAARITPRALIFPCVDEPNAFVRAIAARDRSRAEKVAEWAEIRDVMDDYQAVVEHPECNAIYIPLPVSHHHEWTIKSLEAGKHVLCEKSMAANAVEAKEMAALARTKGLVLMDAFHYRYHPVFQRAKEIVDSGVLNPLVPQMGHLIASTIDGNTKTETRDRRPTYGYQLDAFIQAVEQGAPLHTDGEDAVKQMQLIDRCYQAAGVRLRGER
jgi:predicted dehydrogenase